MLEIIISLFLLTTTTIKCKYYLLELEEAAEPQEETPDYSVDKGESSVPTPVNREM